MTSLLTPLADKFFSECCIASFRPNARSRVTAGEETMIIDRVSEGLSGVLDRDSDVMTSPVDLLSFYGCASPAEPNLSDSEQSWSSASSPQNSDSGRED